MRRKPRQTATSPASELTAPPTAAAGVGKHRRLVSQRVAAPLRRPVLGTVDRARRNRSARWRRENLQRLQHRGIQVLTTHAARRRALRVALMSARSAHAGTARIEAGTSAVRSPVRSIGRTRRMGKRSHLREKLLQQLLGVLRGLCRRDVLPQVVRIRRREDRFQSRVEGLHRRIDRLILLLGTRDARFVLRP